MTVVLPLQVEGWPQIRILTKSSWASAEAWADQPMAQMGPKQTRLGFEFIKCRRCTIEADGFAVFRFVVGKFSGSTYPEFPDLSRYEVRILARMTDADSWTNIWWGTVEQQLDVEMGPAADYLHGAREYHCLDGIAGRGRHWLMDRHGSYVSGGASRPAVGIASSPCRGHPGFNAMRWDGKINGTKESSGAAYDPYGDLIGPPAKTLYGRAFYHTYPGNGLLWSDLEAVQTAFAEARPAGEVAFYLTGVTEYLSAHSVWRVSEGMTLLEFLRMVLRRQRGRGVAFVDWLMTGDPISGTFVPFINIMPPFLGDIAYTPTGIDPNTGSAYLPITLRGATSWGSEITVDLQGDHRLGPNAESTFELGDRASYAVNYLETQGEQIEVVITGAFNDTVPTVEKRWEDSEATAFQSADAITRSRVRFESVYQLFGLARDWGGKAWDGNAGSGVSQMTRADFRCADDGSITVPSSSGVGDTSPLVVEVMRDLPLYTEYDYTQNYPSPRYDGLTKDPVPPVRRAPLLLYRAAPTAAGKFFPLAPAPTNGLTALYQTTFQISEAGITVFVPGDTASGARTIGDTTASPSIGSAIDYTHVVFTLGLRLPHRVRFATGSLAPGGVPGATYTRDNAPRRKVITVPGHHLWLAHVGAIWEIDPTSYDQFSGGYAARKGPANANDTVPGIIRDDRGALEQIHRLAWAWFGDVHSTCSWSLKGCGLLPTFKSGADGTGTTNFPQLGQVPSTILAAGNAQTVATPITVIDYIHVGCETRWATDWCDLDTR